ncbi:uncharacterized protein [Pyrus communis]|uniref:uncharacterized protein n=1 Tax=Pyrus communis TaxID=23211 RepID=UPI0035C15665
MDAKIHLEAGNLGEIIKEDTSVSFQDRAKAMIFIHRHLDEGLKNEYLTVENPLTLWKQQYREIGFTEYNQLISVLFVDEQKNDLLMKNHQSWPTGSAPFPEVNAASLEGNTTSSRGNNYKRGHGHKRGQWNRKGKNHGVHFHNQVPRHNTGPSFKNANRQKGQAHMNTPRNPEGVCYRCGGNGH